MNSLKWRDNSEMEGEFETGCHTESGNELVLYLDTTRELNQLKVNMYEALTKRGKRLGSRQLHEKMCRRARFLKEASMERWRREVDKYGFHGDRDTLRDLANWMVRDFGRWNKERRLV